MSALVFRALVAFAASLGLAILWVLLRRGLGVRDLLPFALGSLPFALWVGAVARLFPDLMRRPAGARRVAGAAVLGLCAALVWSVAATWLLGHRLAALDLPVAWLWALAAMIALLP